MKFLIFSILLLLSNYSGFAQIHLPAIFANGMVLQQNTKVKIWGNAAPMEKVRIKSSWNKQSYHIRADKKGHWLLNLPTPVAGGPYQIEIFGKNRVILSDVLIGEVWLCSGQSNMDMPVKGYFNAPVLHADDILIKSPNANIRLFKLERQAADVPRDSLSGTWQAAGPKSVSEFSAVGYLFGKDLQKFANVPVGIIQSTWGGTPVEAWMSKEALNEVSENHSLKGGATTKAIHQVPSHLFNGMIAPIVGYGLAGVLWYQGEQNRYNAEDYRWLLPEMVKSWRTNWGIGEWPFFFVQIAPMKYPKGQRHLVPLLWEVQTKLATEIPNSGIAVSVDAGDMNNIHPSKKHLIAERLLALALEKHYQKAIPSSAPCYQSISRNEKYLKIRFSNLQMGLTSFGKPLNDFEIAGDDGVFYPAQAEIKNGEVIVFSEQVDLPIAVRYAFKDWTTGSLYGVNGLPVAPFRSDNW